MFRVSDSDWPSPCPVCGHGDFKPFCLAIDRVRRIPEQFWRIERCLHCGYGRTLPPLGEEELAAFYPPGYLGDTAKALDQFRSGQLQRSRAWRSETEKVDLVERLCGSGRILDVGCGDGRFLWALDGRRWQRTGLDISEETLRRVQAQMPALRLISGDIRSVSLETGSYDVVTFWHSLEHLSDPASALARVSALLRPGGWLLVSLPNIDSLQAALFRKYWYPMDDVPRHIHHFSRRALDILLRRSGLKVHAHEYFSRRVSFHSLKHSLLNWALERFGARALYYLLKPALFLMPPLEWFTGRYGILTAVARKPDHRDEDRA